MREIALIGGLAKLVGAHEKNQKVRESPCRVHDFTHLAPFLLFLVSFFLLEK